MALPPSLWLRLSSDICSRLCFARQGGRYQKWIDLGELDEFPEGQTRLAKYKNPISNPWDGETDNIPCWVRRLQGDQFQVFAINCAHLGCPVRWFPQSGLFMCPCHGGVYYQDGSRASGPPERGLFEYKYKVDGGHLMIEAGELPTFSTHRQSADEEQRMPRLILRDRRLVRSASEA